MHGPSFSGDGATALRNLADDYDRRAQAAQHASQTHQLEMPAAH
jgi:hypothetical protein